MAAPGRVVVVSRPGDAGVVDVVVVARRSSPPPARVVVVSAGRVTIGRTGIDAVLVGAVFASGGADVVVMVVVDELAEAGGAVLDVGGEVLDVDGSAGATAAMRVVGLTVRRGATVDVEVDVDVVGAVVVGAVVGVVGGGVVVGTGRIVDPRASPTTVSTIGSPEPSPLPPGPVPFARAAAINVPSVSITRS